MPWLTLKHFSGFSPDLTNWTIEINSDGSFRQKVEMSRPVRRSYRIDRRVLIYNGKLSEVHMDTLRSLIGEVDFAGLNSFGGYPCVTDLSEQKIIVEDQLGAWSFEGPIFFYLNDQKMVEDRPAFLGEARLPDYLTLQELTDMWMFVGDLAPFPPDDERDAPRQSLAQPQPEMRLTVMAPEIPDCFKNRPVRMETPVTFDEIKARLDAALLKAWEYLDKRIIHPCPRNPKFQVLDYFWPQDDGSPLCEVEHLRVLTPDGLPVEDAIRQLIHDGCISSVELVPTRVEDGATHFKLLCHQGRTATVFVRNADQECHPFSLYTGPIIGNDPDVCLGGARFSLDEKQFWQFFRGRWGSRSILSE